MTDRILALRFTRRAIGAAAIAAGEMTLLDGRFLSPRPERVVPSALRYVETLLDIAKPTLVAIDAPAHAGTRGSGLVAEVERLLTQRAVATLRLERHDLLSAFGVRRLNDRRELRDLVRILWPDADWARRSTPHVIDAAAAGFFAETEAAPKGPA